jgi:A/G-specific adenine glycosylase
MPAGPRARSAPRLRGIRAAVLDWYAAEHRDFPWRGTTDPWAVLVSEVMLQQTQASRVAGRFGELMHRFPTPEAMAHASEAEVLAAWSGLGYNRRALTLRRAAAAVVAGGWPADPEGLRSLPGVGAYTARAVAALAFGHRVGAVDTNVRRWLVRRFGLAPGSPARELQRRADALAAPARDAAEAATWMHASMEFGARVCRARAPLCDACPIAAGCPARGRDTPVPVPRQAPFAGSLRAARGGVLRALAAAPDHRLPLRRLAGLVDGAKLDAVLDALERDGLAHRSGQTARLGSADADRSAATIGP